MTPSQIAQDGASAPGGSGGVATALPEDPPKPSSNPTLADRPPPPSQGLLPSLASLMNSVEGSSNSSLLQRSSTVPGPTVNRMQGPIRPSFASPPLEASTSRPSRYEPLYPYPVGNRPSSSHQQSFYSVINSPRTEDGGQIPPPQNPHWQRPPFEGSTSPLFWAAAIGPSGSSSSSTIQSSQQEQAVPASKPRSSASDRRKRPASPSVSPPSNSGTSQPKHRRTHSTKSLAVNAPTDAWLRPAPPRIRNTTQWNVERVQGYKEGYSDAMDAVKRGQLGWDGTTYNNFVFWRHSPALVAAETQSDDGENDDISPYGEDPSPVTDGDDRWSPDLLPVASKHRRPPMGIATRQLSQSSHTAQSTQHGHNAEQNRRQAISCWPCRKRKLKCDGQHPCGTCVRRPAPQGCVYEQEVKRRGKGRKSQPDGAEHSDEVDQLEQTAQMH